MNDMSLGLINVMLQGMLITLMNAMPLQEMESPKDQAIYLSLVYEVIIAHDTIVFIAEESNDEDRVIECVKQITASIPKLEVKLQSKSDHLHPQLGHICKSYIILDLSDYQAHFGDHPFSFGGTKFPTGSAPQTFYFKITSDQITKWDLNATGSRQNKVFQYVDDPPRLPGCDPESHTTSKINNCTRGKLNQYVREAMNYPAVARKSGISGLVIVHFVVERDGTLDEIEVALHRHPLLDQEALRIVRTLQASTEQWIPGKRNGLPVRVRYELPIRFGVL